MKRPRSSSPAPDALEPRGSLDIPAANVPPPDDPLRLIETSLKGLRYGHIVLQVHDGQVVQIEVTEKLRPRR